MPDLTFKGGIHPLQSIHHGKDLTSGRVTRTLPPPAQVILPMASFIGAPAKPIVKRGDTVKMGQLVAEAGGFVSAPIHAPVSGKVAAVENRPHSNGKTSLSVVIDNDFADTPWEEIRPYPPVEDMEPQEILAAIQKAGIVGMGGATFPTHVKLSPPPGTKIDTVILNGAECEPYLTADHRLMLEEPGLVVQGLKAVMRALSVSQGVIGVEVNKRDAIESLRSVIGGGKSIRVASLKVKYPQGGEKQLIYAITRRVVPSGGLPAAVGVAVVNVATAAAIARMLQTGMPVTQRIVTVTGPAVRTPGNLWVRLGTPFSACIEACGGLTGGELKVISGGPMMGLAEATLEVPVMAGTSGILVVPQEKEIASFGRCIRCGRCVEGCPMRLLPTTIEQAARRGDYETCRRLHVMDCLECGSCAYQCPAHVPLLQGLRLGKAAVGKLIREEKAKEGK